MKRIASCIWIFMLYFLNIAASNKEAPFIVYENNKLSYVVDSLGNRVLDFSYAGYKSGNSEIPNESPTLIIEARKGDMTSHIQNAINLIESRKVGKNGIRGVLLLDKGVFEVEGSLKIKKSGVVLRGKGYKEGTEIIATGSSRRTLIEIEGVNDQTHSSSIKITEKYVPVNALSFTVENSTNLKVGDLITINRPSTQEWINELKTDHFGGGITALGWKPGNHDINWDRTITKIEGNKITINAPISTAIDSKYGGATISTYSWDGRIAEIGVENMLLTSEYNKENKKDEDHAWTAITVANAENIWIRNIEFKHFAGSAVLIETTSKQVTVGNCKYLEPISEIGGFRRNAFITYGQLCLFNNLYAENANHAFSLGLGSAGPNVFVQCEATDALGYSGPIDSWSSGVLYDIVNIDGNALSFKNRMNEYNGIGWNAANSVFWQCSASLVECYTPPTAENYSFGSWAEFAGDGYWVESNNHIKPRSLYFAQLAERLNDSTKLVEAPSEVSSSPTMEAALNATKEAKERLITRSDKIDIASSEIVFPSATAKTKLFEDLSTTQIKANEVNINVSNLTLKNGRLLRDNKLQLGAKTKVQWWNGNLKPKFINNSKPHITRFVPGRKGMGFTDELDDVILWMNNNNMQVLDHNYGLWYERRRDDHERIRRLNADVWAPFYEQPFARSGEGEAFDKLSKYDLTKFNTWYWTRLKDFADQANQAGMVLLHHNYFQHNIIEAGAHWTDSPWRPANNINNTGFPEPVPYAGDKRIFMAEQFYDVDNPKRVELHKNYIRKCLDNFKDNGNVIQLISEEYTGPLHFVEFWLDVISEWEKENNTHALIALSTTKDVQDAILKDPVRSKIVDIIDIKYWFYRKDKTTYNPQGGVNLAPRQHARLTKMGGPSFASVYDAVKEYRESYPDKAVTYYANQYDKFGWASLMATGSLMCLPESIKNNELFLEDVANMDIIATNVTNQYVIGNKNLGYIIYSENETIELDFIDKSKFDLYRINKQTGKITKEKKTVTNKTQFIQPHQEIVWLKKG